CADPPGRQTPIRRADEAAVYSFADWRNRLQNHGSQTRSGASCGRPSARYLKALSDPTRAKAEQRIGEETAPSADAIGRHAGQQEALPHGHSNRVVDGQAEFSLEIGADA